MSDSSQSSDRRPAGSEKGVPRSLCQPGRVIWRHAKDHKILLSGYIVLCVLGVVTESFGVFLLVPLLETIGKGNIFSNVAFLGSVSQLFESLPSDQRLVWAGFIMLVVVMLRGMQQFAQDYIGYAIPHRVDLALRLKVFDTLAASNMHFVDSLGAGQMSNVTVAHPARIGIAVRFAATFVANIFVLASFVLVLSLVAPILCAAAFAYVLISSIFFKSATGSWGTRVGRDLTESNARFGQILFELLNGSRLIRLSGASAVVRRELIGVVKTLSRARDRTVAVENITVPFFSIVGGTLICILVIGVGMMQPEAAAQAVGVLVLFVVLLFRILAPLSIINISRSNIALHIDAFEELDKFFAAARQQRDTDGTLELPAFNEAIRLEGVTMTYGRGERPAVESVSLEIPKGSMTAIVGPSGSGKTTLINLITRLYRPSTGQVSVDGTPIDLLAIESFWKKTSVVTQDVILINDTIRANLSLGLPVPPQESDMREATRKAAIEDWIDSLPKGFDTVLSDRGRNLSGGQRQRMAIARAFLRNPDIIILDEATSALDSLTEHTIQQQILRMTGDKTIIVIAHRLSTVRHADQIIVLDGGRVVQKGTHNELAQQQGLYQRLVQSQNLDLGTDAPSTREVQNSQPVGPEMSIATSDALRIGTAS